MSIHIKKQKTYFSIVVIVLMASILGGMYIFRDENLTFIVKKFRYIPYKFALVSSQENTGIIQNLLLLVRESNNLESENKIEVKGIPVLLYHGIVQTPDRFSLTQEVFKDHLFALKRAGYETITLRDLENTIGGGTTTLPKKPFLLTFDDGRMDSYEMADPLLQALHYTAVMFVATDASLPPTSRKKSTYYIASSTIQDMVSSGRWEIGSHAIQDTGGFISLSADGTKGNFLSNKKWLDAESRLENDSEYRTRIQQEFVASQRALEDTFHIKVNSFSYPFGDYGQQQVNNLNATATVNTLIKDTYQLAFKQVWPNDGEFTFNYHDTDPYFLKRIETPTEWTGAQLIAFLETAQDKTFPFVDDFTKDNGWKRTWGLSTLTDNHLVVQATASTTGAAVFLDGTKLWDKYTYTTTMNWRKGSHVSLMTKYQDSKNYYVCTFSDATVRLERMTNGKSVVLNEAKNFIHPAKENISLGVVVQDNFMRCRVGPYTSTFATINPGAGGIGVKIWDKELNNAEVQLQRIMVEGIPTL